MILLVQKNELLTIFFLEFGHKKKLYFPHLLPKHM